MTKLLRLGEFAEVGAGNSAPQNSSLFKGGTLPFVRTSDVGAIHIGSIESSRDLLTPEGAKGLRLFPAGTILFPKSGASTFLNHRVILNSSAYVSSHLATIKANSEVALDRYIYYFLQLVDARDLCQDQAYPSLNRYQIAGIDVPIPSLMKQETVVKKLDKAFAEIDSLEKNLQLKEEKNNQLLQSMLSAVFTITEQFDMKVVKLKDVLSIERGSSMNSGIYIGLEDIEAQTGKYIGNFVPRNVKSLTFKFTPEHLLYGRLRPYLNKVLLPSFSGHCSTEIFPIMTGESLQRDYLFYWLTYSTTVEKLNKTATGSRMPRADMNKFLDLDFYLPSMPAQKEIVYKLETAFAEIDKLKNQISIEKERISSLRQSILSNAFNFEEKAA
jgi:restriction endonuclease S subunit